MSPTTIVLCIGGLHHSNDWPQGRFAHRRRLAPPREAGVKPIDFGPIVAQISRLSMTVDTRSRRLRVLGQPEPAPRDELPRHPPWIRTKLPTGRVYFDLRERVHALGLHTVCESASCPNVGECWSAKSLTIMILGALCTRSCKFCDVPTGRPAPPDPDEPERVATILAELGLAHAVLTCVTRDDLADGGAAHWAATIREVRARCPQLVLEALVSDFRGDAKAVDVVLDAGPDVFAHNLETVPRLSRQVRVQASVERSLAVLAHASRRSALTKSGLMLGLGETLDEIRETMRLLRDAGVEILTLGQYLRPSRQHLPVARHVTPAEFLQLKEEALAMGFAHVESGPLVRSSYHASNQHALVEQRRRSRQTQAE
jgi:lipoic acid synthetase